MCLRADLHHELKAAIAYGTRVLLGHCPHEWEYRRLAGVSHRADQEPQRCRWCGETRIG